ncbi:MAG: Excinuclease ABC, C subunit-like protein [Candidatus Magasanikbacteria bacterium GW2011_GWA2_50_22]|uniref:Excinuclease ABC, C subunit-like protein n=2 Tax=Parcubacteria group TaxID=1794811 RepID=A0A0G1YR10_9BACT|nr:MAG: Excinuclease ABC, C subunit-like protein [Candidatus Magasanikbacteria bacterium GW2011_GWA2_50_22]
MSLMIPCVYILASKRNGTLYTGVTSHLEKRLQEHQSGTLEGFTKKYHVHMLVYYEVHETIADAISREKQIKGGSRKKKLALIESVNPAWRDLSGEL